MPPRPFRYLADPLMLTGIAAYWIHKLWIKPTLWGSSGLLHDYLNDFLLIPIFLPPTLYLHHLLRIRPHHRPPTPAEITLHVALWSILFLLVFPHSPWLYRHSTPDPYNALAFAAGGAAAWLIWNRPRTQSALPFPRMFSLPTNRYANGEDAATLKFYTESKVVVARWM